MRTTGGYRVPYRVRVSYRTRGCTRGAMRAYARRSLVPAAGLALPRFTHPRDTDPRAASPDHFLLKPRPLSSAYRSMKRMKRFHSAVVFIT